MSTCNRLKTNQSVSSMLINNNKPIKNPACPNILTFSSDIKVYQMPYMTTRNSSATFLFVCLFICFNDSFVYTLRVAWVHEEYALTLSTLYFPALPIPHNHHNISFAKFYVCVCVYVYVCLFVHMCVCVFLCVHECVVVLDNGQFTSFHILREKGLYQPSKPF